MVSPRYLTGYPAASTLKDDPSLWRRDNSNLPPDPERIEVKTSPDESGLTTSRRDRPASSGVLYPSMSANCSFVVVMVPPALVSMPSGVVRLIISRIASFFCISSSFFSSSSRRWRNSSSAALSCSVAVARWIPVLACSLISRKLHIRPLMVSPVLPGLGRP